MFGNVFSPIPDKIVESIKAKLDQKDIYKQEISQEDYKAGDKLIIEKGKFAGIPVAIKVCLVILHINF